MNEALPGPSSPPQLLSVPDAARFLNVSLRTFQSLVARREIAVLRIGRRVVVHPDDLMAFVATMRQGSRTSDGGTP